MKIKTGSEHKEYHGRKQKCRTNSIHWNNEPGWRCTSVVEHLPSIWEALRSIPASPPLKKIKKEETQKHSRLYCKTTGWYDLLGKMAWTFWDQVHL
jgi:hypothetical protein